MQHGESLQQFDDVDAMRMGVEYTFQVSLPRSARRYALRPVSNAEMMQCYHNVWEYVSKLPKTAQNKISEDHATAREILKQASSPFGTYAPTITDHILDQLTLDQVTFLYKEWLATCEKVNPNIEHMEDGQMREVVEMVKKNSPEDLDYQLTDLSFWQLRDLVRYLLTKGD